MSHNQFAISASSPLRSFAFPEDQVQAAADQSHGEADPGQDVGGAVGALLEAGRVEAVLLICVDGGCDHHAQAGQQLDDGGENESFPLLELEELKDEDKEADAA